MVDQVTINVVKDFSPYPAGRTRKDGPYSGEAFRKDRLIPALESANIVVINIDGVAGLPSSFWEEIFGGLVRTHYLDANTIRQRIKVTTHDSSLQPFVRLAQKFAEEAA